MAAQLLVPPSERLRSPAAVSADPATLRADGCAGSWDGGRLEVAGGKAPLPHWGHPACPGGAGPALKSVEEAMKGT